jgi:hypothetical protein
LPQKTSSVAYGLSRDINVCFASAPTSYILTFPRYSLGLTDVKLQLLQNRASLVRIIY